MVSPYLASPLHFWQEEWKVRGVCLCRGGSGLQEKPNLAPDFLHLIASISLSGTNCMNTDSLKSTLFQPCPEPGSARKEDAGGEWMVAHYRFCQFQASDGKISQQ